MKAPLFRKRNVVEDPVERMNILEEIGYVTIWRETEQTDARGIG